MVRTWNFVIHYQQSFDNSHLLCLYSKCPCHFLYVFSSIFPCVLVSSFFPFVHHLLLSLIPFMLICFIFVFILSLVAKKSIITAFCFFFSSFLLHVHFSHLHRHLIVVFLPCYHGCKKHYGRYFSSPFCSKTFVFFFSFFWSYSHGCKKSGMFINHNPFY